MGRDELEARLSTAALEIVDQKILPSLWYPIAATAELSQLVVDIDGGGRVSHMAKLGAETATRLLGGGTFKSFVDGASRNKTNIGESLIRLSELMIDFYEDREFFDAIIGESISNLGWANQDSKEDNIGRINQDAIRWCIYEMNLMGDPETSANISMNHRCAAPGLISQSVIRLPRIIRRGI